MGRSREFVTNLTEIFINLSLILDAVPEEYTLLHDLIESVFQSFYCVLSFDTLRS